MATSGTIGQKTFTAAQVIEHAFRRCGKVASTITSEQLEIAQDSLALLLANMVNQGINLWCLEKVILGIQTDQITYTLPIGTIDVLNVYYRTSTTVTPTWTTSATEWSGLFDASTSVVTVSFVPTTTQTLTLALETSQDGVTWATARTVASASYSTSETYYFDIDPVVPALYFRIRETVAASMSLTSVSLITQNSEIPVARINRDDYTSLPNKRSQGTPTQFWLDRQTTPRIWLWPMPAAASSIAVWRNRDVQDVGALINQIEVPSRWVDATAWQLAAKLCFEIPDIAPDKISMIVQMAEKFNNSAMSGEYDNSPFYLRPNIGCYNA